VNLLAINGSLRRDSYNGLLLEAAARELPSGVQLEQLGGLAELPHYDQDLDAHEPAHPAVRRLRDALRRADAVLISTPEYNASLPGALKNALDWASRPFPDNCLRGTPVAVVGASTSLFGAVWAQAEARKVLNAIGAAAIDLDLPVSRAQEAFAADGELLDPEHRARLAEIVAALLARVPEDLREARPRLTDEQSAVSELRRRDGARALSLSEA